MIEITEEEYENLLAARNWAAALEHAGVDNWDGYEYAVKWLKENYGDKDGNIK